MSFAELIYPSPEDTNLHVTTAMDSNEKTEASPIARISKKIDFILCNSCFWCASYLNLGRNFGVIECHSCKENMIERMSLSAKRRRLDYDVFCRIAFESHTLKLMAWLESSALPFLYTI